MAAAEAEAAAAAAAATGDLVARCKDKLNRFRIKELKDVLHQIGLSKQGKKQELMDRIMAVLLDEYDQASKRNGFSKKKMVEKETVVRIVDDTFRKMQDPATAGVASRSQTESGHNVKSKKKPDDSSQWDVKIRCPCGKYLATDSMIKCEDPRCNVWQHIGCVVIPEKSAEGVAPEMPSSFYCEMCRINRADPFWVTIVHPLLPMIIAPSSVAADGSYTVQYVEKTFPLSRVNREMLQKAEYELQVWCILLNDKVPFRMHWPLHSDIQLNGVQLRVVNRQPTQQLGGNGRDDGLIVTSYCREGPNKIVMARGDPHTFCLGVRIAKRISVEQVLNLVPKEEDGENFDDALTRVRRCVGGGTKADNADSDSDIEVVSDSVSVNLRCPMSGSRIKTAGRFKPCVHMGGFDLEAFVELNQRSRKWQCPICLKNYSLENIIIDPYFNRITSLIQKCGDDVTEIDVKPDGSWRVKGRVELKDLAQWHLPDGTLCMSVETEAKPNVDNVNQEVKQEPFSEENSCVKLGIRKNDNGQWEINKTEGFSLPSSGNDLTGDFENKNRITLRSNANGNLENAEDRFVNLEQGHFDYPMSDVNDLDSVPMDEYAPAASKEQDIIVLSDSDDDDITVLSPSAVNFSSARDVGIPCPSNPPETSGVYGEESGTRIDKTPYLGHNEGSDDLRLSFWEYPFSPQNDPTYQLFDPGTPVAHNLGEVENHPVNCQSLNEPVSGGNLGEAADKPLEYGNHGSLQAFISSGLGDGTVRANPTNHNETCTNGHSDKWISLSLGGVDGSLMNANNASQKRINSGGELTDLDASFPSSENNDLTEERTSRSERSHGPFSPPRQPRSVRQRLIVSIDSDSD